MLMSDNGEAREYLESCYRMKKTTINPIIDWEDEDVWEFIHTYNIPYCELYDKGWKRLGCIGCPLGGKKKQREELEQYPKYKKLYLLAFEKMLRVFDEDDTKSCTWETPQDVMDWWIGDEDKRYAIEGQISMDDDFINEVQIDD